MTKVLITSTNCSWNKGSAAQVISAIKILKEFVPNPSFTLISYCTKIDEEQSKKYHYDLDVVGYYSKKPNLTTSILYRNSTAFVKSCAYVILHKFGLNVGSVLNDLYLNEYIKNDIIINLSGDSYSDGKGGNSILNSIEILIGLALNKPIIFFSQSVGPFSKFALPLTIRCLNRAKLIIVRESISEDYLNKFDIKAPIFCTADCAFVLDTAPYDKVIDILSKENIDITNKPLIGISANAFLDDPKYNYINLMSQLVDYLIEKHNAQVIFVPHVLSITEGGKRDDRIIGEKIYRLAKNQDKISLIYGDYSPEELKGIIGLMDVFIGGRMHANIAALSSCVPSLATAWSHKYYGIMRELGQEKYVCDFRTMSLDELKSKMDDLWDNKAKIRNELRNKVKDQKRLAWYSGELVRDALRPQN